MTDYFSEEATEEGFDDYKSWRRTALFVYRILPISAIVLIFGGIITGIYLLIKRVRKKKEIK